MNVGERDASAFASSTSAAQAQIWNPSGSCFINSST